MALWQAMPQNEDHWFDKPNEIDHPATAALEPFHKDSQGSFFDSNDVRYCEDLNYTYPHLTINSSEGGIEGVQGGDQQAQLIRPINETYGLTRSTVLNLADDLDDKENDYVINIIYDNYVLK